MPQGLEVSGVVLSDQVKCLDWRARRAEFICRVPDTVTFDVLAKLSTLVDPDQ